MNEYYQKNTCFKSNGNAQAQLNSDLSKFIANDIPTHEINQSIYWLRTIRDDYDYRIQRLKSILRDRQRNKNWKRAINEIAKDYFRDDLLHLSEKQRYENMRQRLDISPAQLKRVHKIVEAWIKKRQTELRNARICHEYDCGLKVSQIAENHQITPQAVYYVLKNRQDHKIL